jgi:hypothetical protein
MTVVTFPPTPWTKPKTLEDWPWDDRLGKPTDMTPCDVEPRDINGPVEELLVEREKTHGPYAVKCEIIMAIMREVEGHRGHLSDVQNVSLDMIIHKMGRVLAGDANCADHWDDIAGYAKLVTRDLMAGEPNDAGC